jgi:hypothetical protein
VGETLIWTLEKGLGEGFTPGIKLAWSTAFASLSAVMVAANKDPVPSDGAT